ncbi:EKC/KEOPS complex subunit Tprkb [Cephus cinctus]|uniref:EKC/KEOPS complex subunit Tprkb n=1 Tax=Cephus cinctus TaxID=211228 RepID=A0AAJ7CDK3_CEPCN|nr:EKC/KEOPS complex subunit Tprkb [Cephus cinctus]
MSEYTMKLDDTTEKHLTLLLFADVENARDVKTKLINGELRCCVLKASLIVDPFQVVVAANKAALKEMHSRLTTKTVFTEILFDLSLSKNITQSLIKFGIDDAERNILVAVIHSLDDKKSIVQKVVSSIKGQQVSIDKLKDYTDLKLVRKTYKIEDTELTVSNLVDSLVSRISTKDFASY